MKNKFLVSAILLTLILPQTAAAELIKSQNGNTVYYLDNFNNRHPFPNLTTFQSWFGNDFSSTKIVSEEALAKLPLGKNITIRPGTFLIKAQTAPTVYAVEQGGVIRPISSEIAAEEVFGQNWNKKIVDVPDVFFGNYTLGKTITSDNDIPDNVLYYNTNKKKYYFKSMGIVRPFSSESAVLANHLKLSDAIAKPYDFSEREKPITGLDKSVFNPAESAYVSRVDCENKKLKAAVIVVAAQETKGEELSKVELIKNKISETYSWATSGLSEIDLNYPTSVIYDNGYILSTNEDGTTEIKSELLNTFYETNPDDFDIIFIFTNFKTPEENTNEIAHYATITNRQTGTGRYQIESAHVYGSAGKLKGAIVMGNINKYDFATEKGKNQVLDIILHEIGHQWLAYINYYDGTETANYGLLRDDKIHWSYYAGFISPLGGSGWIDNGDGTFTSALAQLPEGSLRKYSTLDLYLMGLIPAQVVGPVFYVQPTIPNQVGNIIDGKKVMVNIDQIIRGNGPIQCNLSK